MSYVLNINNVYMMCTSDYRNVWKRTSGANINDIEKEIIMDC